MFLHIYAGMLVLLILVTYGRVQMFIYAGVCGSRTMHSQLLNSILMSTFSFFDQTPSGRIASRFSVDMKVVDFDIPVAVYSVLESFMGIIAGVVMVCIQSPIFIVLFIPLCMRYFQTGNLYRLPSKALKRLDSAAKSPVLSFFKENLEGLECIRGYNIQRTMINRHYELLDRSICVRLNWDAVNRWLGIRLDIIGALIVSFAAFSVALSGKSSAGVAGLLITYALRSTQALAFAVRGSTAIENMFNSPERIFEYIDNEHEHGEHGDNLLSNEGDGDIVLQDMPSAKKAILEAINLSARYSPELPIVIDNISFTVNKGELIGLCGRTG
jgi:ABC-type multidrug transport system fused ATPase/permease subunit